MTKYPEYVYYGGTMETGTVERTTIVVDPRLRNEVKSVAALQGKGLREFVEETLREAVGKVLKKHPR